LCLLQENGWDWRAWCYGEGKGTGEERLKYVTYPSSKTADGNPQNPARESREEWPCNGRVGLFKGHCTHAWSYNNEFPHLLMYASSKYSKMIKII
jgi:hypothetical protein